MGAEAGRWSLPRVSPVGPVPIGTSTLRPGAPPVSTSRSILGLVGSVICDGGLPLSQPARVSTPAVIHATRHGLDRFIIIPGSGLPPGPASPARPPRRFPSTAHKSRAASAPLLDPL